MPDGAARVDTTVRVSPLKSLAVVGHTIWALFPVNTTEPNSTPFRRSDSGRRFCVGDAIENPIKPCGTIVCRVLMIFINRYSPVVVESSNRCTISTDVASSMCQPPAAKKYGFAKPVW